MADIGAVIAQSTSTAITTTVDSLTQSLTGLDSAYTIATRIDSAEVEVKRLGKLEATEANKKLIADQKSILADLRAASQQRDAAEAVARQQQTLRNRIAQQTIQAASS